MASRDLTKHFLERRSAAMMRRRTAGEDSNGVGVGGRRVGGGLVSGTRYLYCSSDLSFDGNIIKRGLTAVS